MWASVLSEKGAIRSWYVVSAQEQTPKLSELYTIVYEYMMIMMVMSNKNAKLKFKNVYKPK